MSFRVYLSPVKPGWMVMWDAFRGKTFRLGKKTRTVIDVTFSGDIITRGTNNAGFHSGRWNGERIPGEQWMDWVKNATEVKHCRHCGSTTHPAMCCAKDGHGGWINQLQIFQKTGVN